MTTDTKTSTTKTKLLLADLDRPSLHGLSYALRHPDTWPPGFSWNYGRCVSCAMGLARSLWVSITPFDSDANVRTDISDMARAFAMPYEAAGRVFMGNAEHGVGEPYRVPGRFWGTNVAALGDVTPGMVADEIDRYLETVE